MFIVRSILFLAILVTPRLTIAFSIQKGSQRNRSVHSPRSKKQDSDNDNWTLEKEWILTDQVPKFTIGEDESLRRTFWTQLGISTPLLSSFSDSELQRRYEVLQESKNDSTAPKLPLAGPSPPVLQSWSIDDQGRVSGQLQGRSVWFVAHLIGRFEGDPMSVFDSKDPKQALLAGGFVEAIGGRVYELGQPNKEQLHLASTFETGNSGVISEKEQDKGFFKNLPIISATTATMSALVASAVLSACIGYGAGLSIISDSSSSRPYHAFPPAQTATTVSIAKRTTPSKLSTDESKVGLSVSEQRARKEARVLREQRVIKKISENLEIDQAELQRLRQQEDARS